MPDLSLNQKGLQFACNQTRLVDFFTAYAAKENVEFDINEDKYLAPALLKGDLLAHFVSKVQAPAVQWTAVQNFEVFMESVTPEQISTFQCNMASLFSRAQGIDSTCVLVPDFGHYDVLLYQFAKVVEALQQIEGIPQVDFNAEKYLLEFSPSDTDIKLAINLLGTQVIAVMDNNKELDKEPNAFGNNLWAMYIIVMVGTFAFQIVVKNLQYYAQFIGATASQTTNLTTYFNLVQLFFSFFWLWLSDIIGRKPVFIITLGIYAITSGIFTVVPSKDSYSTQIAIMQGLRAAMGVGAVTAPLGFVIGADLAPPKNRGLVTVLVNIATQIGSIFASLITIWFGSGKQYDTRDLVTGSVEYNQRNIKSFVDAHFWAMGFFIFTMLLCVVILKESHPRIIALRKLKKMGIGAPKTQETNAEPIWRVFIQMCKNRDLVLLFFAYWINLIGATNSRTGGQVFITKMYGFSDVNYAKSYSNTAQVVCILISIILSAFCTKPFIKWFGEVRVIIMSQVTSNLESIINAAINMPIAKGIMYVSLILTSFTLIFCDAIFLQLVSMYTTPQNRGQVLGIFQLGNSIGRTLSGVVTGVMYDYNIREAQLFNTLFASVCLFLLAMVRPPLQRTEMDAAAQKMKEQKISENKI